MEEEQVKARGGRGRGTGTGGGGGGGGGVDRKVRFVEGGWKVELRYLRRSGEEGEEVDGE